MAVGYFVVTAGYALLRSWSARSREALSAQREPVAGQGPVAVADVPVVIGTLVNCFTERLWWWLAPVLTMVAFWVVFVMYTRRAGIAVTPFMYTLF
jgi:membrane glycosyltransferase